LREVAGVVFGLGIDEFVVFIDAEDAVRGEAFDGEWSGYADFGFVVVRFVVEVFVVGFGGDGGVDFANALNAGKQDFTSMEFVCPSIASFWNTAMAKILRQSSRTIQR
jgi:hypothetical protein